ncbi:MAG TPA: cytochrome c [Xanthomonadales bacterium]|nr:cytochrome c [Xanthomonadales bacterium]
MWPFLCALLLCAAAPGVVAADLANGQAIYYGYCASCHGTNPTIGSPATVRGDPARVDAAIATIPQMSFLGPLLDAGDRADVAAFIGNALGIPASTPFQGGWYWNPAEGGRGFFLERQADRFFLAGFHYDDAGNAIWFTGQGTVAGSVLRSPMSMFRDGQSLTGAYRAPTALPSPGELAIDFGSSTTNATMAWPGGNVTLQRFGFTANSVVAPPQAGAPQSGWWWNAAESGRGFALEFQGDAVFGAGFLYADDGDPTWYVVSGRMATPTRYAGDWIAFTDGQAMGAPYRPPLRAPDPGAVVLEFGDATHGTLVLPDGRRVPLVRFAF